MTDDRGHSTASLVALVFGGLLHLIVGVLLLPLGLVAPPWALLLFWVVWLGAVAVAWNNRHRPVLVLLTPFAVVAIVWLGLVAGERLLGWTA